MVLLLSKLYLPRIQRGPLFSRGCQTFPGGVQMLISLETHIGTCYFPGGGVVRTPYPPLDPHMGNVIITGQ